MKQQILVWFTASAVLSVFLPNVVVCTLFVPVAVKMLAFLGVKDIGASRVATPILLAIVWGAGVGGFGSPLGGSANLVAISYLEEVTGHEFMYWSWIERFTLPLLAVMALNVAFLWSIRTGAGRLPGTRAYFKEAYGALGPMRRDEHVALWLFAAATLLAFARPAYAAWLPALKPAYVFLVLGLLTFVLPRQDGQPFAVWKRAEKEIMWGMLFLFAGGLALGALVTATGAAQRIAELITRAPLDGGLGTVLAFNAFGCVLTEISSNTAAAAIAIPVVRSISESIGVNPVPYIYCSIIAVNCAYVLPVSIRAIAVGFGLDPARMFRHGLALSAATLALISVVGWAMMRLWPGFSAG
ncbi:MAG: citrate transporter [Duodenibacillus sp.]|nr:citrate transporter [Duodenibacillus sp.]